MILFKINGISLTKNPTDINQSKQIVANSGRTIDGTLVMDIIANKDNLAITWDYLSSIDMNTLQTQINNSGFVTIEYADPLVTAGQLKQITATVKSLAYSPYYDNKTSTIMWQNIKANFVEI